MWTRYSVACIAICLLLVGVLGSASARNRWRDLLTWAPESIDHALKMRIYKDPDRRPSLPPRSISKIERDYDPTGIIATFQPRGATFTARNAFFESLGTNGRTCFTCHQPQDGWSLSAAGARGRFEASGGLDPLFRRVDGATCPSAPVATFEDRRQAYKLLIEKGLIRIGLALPPASQLQFAVTAVEDPHGCTTSPTTGLTSPTTGIVSVYRRPLPAANLGFLPTIMWDGREPTLESQAVDATLLHAQANGAPDPARQAQIVGFEKGLVTAQIFDETGHSLTDANATGGPVVLSLELPSLYTGINNPTGLDPVTQAPFDRNIFHLYKPWLGLPGDDTEAQKRRSIARGEQVFNSGICGGCHNTPDVGNRSADEFQDIGVSVTSDAAPLDIAGLPVFTLTCTQGPLAGRTFKVTDPGRALITGQCADIGRFKVPGMRGLAARAPYFHNGSARSLTEVVGFYVRKFKFELSAAQKEDLVNFLAAL